MEFPETANLQIAGFLIVCHSFLCLVSPAFASFFPFLHFLFVLFFLHNFFQQKCKVILTVIG